MDLPSNAPDWARQAGSVLVDAGFRQVEERSGGMLGFLARFKREDLVLEIVADRGDWWMNVVAPNPLPTARGRARTVPASLDEYLAGLRQDTNTDALFEEPEIRSEKAAAWLVANIDVLLRTYRDAQLWMDVKALQKARSKRLFSR